MCFERTHPSKIRSASCPSLVGDEESSNEVSLGSGLIIICESYVDALDVSEVVGDDNEDEDPIESL